MPHPRSLHRESILNRSNTDATRSTGYQTTYHSPRTYRHHPHILTTNHRLRGDHGFAFPAITIRASAHTHENVFRRAILHPTPCICLRTRKHTPDDTAKGTYTYTYRSAQNVHYYHAGTQYTRSVRVAHKQLSNTLRQAPHTFHSPLYLPHV